MWYQFQKGDQKGDCCLYVLTVALQCYCLHRKTIVCLEILPNKYCNESRQTERQMVPMCRSRKLWTRLGIEMLILQNLQIGWLLEGLFVVQQQGTDYTFHPIINNEYIPVKNTSKKRFWCTLELAKNVVRYLWSTQFWPLLLR